MTFLAPGTVVKIVSQVKTPAAKVIKQVGEAVLVSYPDGGTQWVLEQEVIK